MSTTNAATPAKRFALIGEIDGQAVASGFWRNEAAAGDAHRQDQPRQPVRRALARGRTAPLALVPHAARGAPVRRGDQARQGGREPDDRPRASGPRGGAMSVEKRGRKYRVRFRDASGSNRARTFDRKATPTPS